ncbi:MAG: triosephosphate isomerase, partial [Firmicutes bacterium]|nr:triosephosphate isomerase [Bacillota bacterium]
MRKKMIAGNWKMNKTPKEAVELVKLLKDKVNTKESDVVFCVPAIDILPVVEELKGTDIMVGAQNMHYEDKGAYTGELSADMLIESGVSHVIIGHSERRAYNGETDETVNKKLKKAIEKKLTAIVCVGENLEERESGKAIDV